MNASTSNPESNSELNPDSKNVPHASADDMDEPVGDTEQSSLDEQEKRKHEPSENALPSSQEKNQVPPGAAHSSQQ